MSHRNKGPWKGALYCVRPKRRPVRWALYGLAVCALAGALSACVARILQEPEGFEGVPCRLEPALESPDTSEDVYKRQPLNQPSPFLPFPAQVRGGRRPSWPAPFASPKPYGAVLRP